MGVVFYTHVQLYTRGTRGTRDTRDTRGAPQGRYPGQIPGGPPDTRGTRGTRDTRAARIYPVCPDIPRGDTRRGLTALLARSATSRANVFAPLRKSGVPLSKSPPPPARRAASF